MLTKPCFQNMQLFFFRHVRYCLFISTISSMDSYRKQEFLKQFKEMQMDGVKVPKMKEIADWVEPFRQLWETRYSQLDAVFMSGG